ncbi:AAA family ATPase [Nocardiopsis ansamitocini]|uniref:Gluconate kinase n=1 Tax=Nocardiopsis ansamitocini TaxID=1670832 RepID=A0A9W6P9N5_9ACTN|nr:AAA family ATPase [Nocardiopsis ansamitocini]GLU49537.1 hypothetical protein Nans01_38880 [Nocardiopsis ansamitocini]
MQPNVAGARYADIRETHAGVVVLIGEKAYKLKKPKDFGFLDYSTRELRLAACLREVELNSRLAPDVYEGVLDVVDSTGRPFDHLIAMRRMPESRRLSTLVHGDRDLGGELRAVARLLAAFHSRAPSGPEVREQGSTDALRGRWAASLHQIRPFRGEVLGGETEEIERLALRFVDGRQALFTARVDAGRVIDGHGDLLADDIFCLDDGPRILDCLEFDDRLRWVDALDDAAFLAMDLERLGAAGAAEVFLRLYAEFTGDPAPASLHHHYVAYRALVRAKVACLRHTQGDGSAGPQARLLEHIALGHLRDGAVRLVVVGGTPATGKTTVAGGLADLLGAVLISSDRVRKEQCGISPLASSAAAFGEGPYDAETSRRVYTEILERAGLLLANGESVVLDACWADASWRQAAAMTAEDNAADFTQFRCTAPAATVARRLAERPRDGCLSDADAAIERAVSSTFAPWPDATCVDTSHSVRAALEEMLAVARPSPPVAQWLPSRPLLTAD